MTENAREKIKEKEEWLEKCKEIFRNEEIFTEKNNKVWISGTIEEEFEYYFTLDGVNQFRTYVSIKRKSNTIDCIPLVIPESFKDISWKEKVKERKIQIAGQLRTRNRKGEDGKSHLDVYVFATSAWLIDEEEQFVPENRVYIYGTICQNPIFRKTPRKKEITELKVAVNRSNNCSDYLPTITWFEDAYKTQYCNVGDKLEIYGKFQSRPYHNNERVAYELSVNEVELKGI